MITRRVTAIAIALGLGLSGVAVMAGSAGAASGPDFSKLKHVKAPSPCTNDPGVSSSEIKIGTLLPESGALAASFADSLIGFKARVDDANSSGELGKRKITIVSEDAASDPARNVTGAQKLVEQENVFAIYENDPNADASARYLNSKGVPVVGWHLGLASFGKYPNFFGWRNSFPPDAGKNTFTDLNYLFMKQKGATKVALVATNIANSANFANNIADSIKLSKDPSVKVVYKTTSVSADQRDFTAEAQKIKDSGADAVATGMDFLANTALASALTQNGYRSKLKVFLFPAAEDERVLQLPGIEGDYFGTEVIPFEQNPPSYLKYKAAMQKAGKFFNGEVPYIGWLSADTLIQGVKDAGVSCPTRKAFINNLRLEKHWSANGAFNAVNFIKAFAKPLYCVYFVQVTNATFVPQDNGKPFCATKEFDNGKVKKLSQTEILNA